MKSATLQCLEASGSCKREFNDPPNLLGYQSLIELVKGSKPQNILLIWKTMLIPALLGDLRLAISITPTEFTSHRFQLPVHRYRKFENGHSIGGSCSDNNFD